MDAVRLRPSALCAILRIAGLLSACDGGEIGYIASLSESEPEAVMTVGMACAVAHGPTIEYGLLATDTDLVGGGHRDHGPLLTGLQLDTTYHFTVCGITPDGTVYRGKDMTFLTMPAGAAPSGRPVGQNLFLSSLGARVVDTSSNYADS